MRPSIFIEHFLYVDTQEVNSFLIACRETRRAMIVDCGGFDDELEQIVNKFRFEVESLFLTHSHHDHTGGISHLLNLFPDIEIIAAEYSYSGRVRKPGDGEVFNLGILKGRFHHVPGHTDDMMVLFINGHLFTGDALFAGSVGGTTSNENYELQIQGICSKLLVYPNDTIIHPGHGPDSTIELEKSFNPFLQCY